MRRIAGITHGPWVIVPAAFTLMVIPVMDFTTMNTGTTARLQMIGWSVVFLAGISFLIRHKLLWLAGLVLCALYIAINMSHLFFFPDAEMANEAVAFKIVSSIVVAGIAWLYFARSPDLDRRQHWLGQTAHRFYVDIPAVLGGKDQCKSIDLSYTGARFSVAQAREKYKVGQRVSIEIPDIDAILCQGKIIAVSYNEIRVHFVDTSDHEKELIRQWLSSQNLQGV
ncbi:PilZ domain-containing protein [Bdellovibrio sp. HCB209]|uniref:PilZ domain-containing protein n=1 Tax=Bdellovibrio sp. HCB209 TaxID=3394354 RepID=UPI0039B6CD95